MLVVDASAAVAFLTDPTRRHDAYAAFSERGELHAPAHLDLEVASALRRAVDAGRLAEPRARAALADLRDLPLHRHHTDWLTDRIWALREHVSPYDAAYLALAEALEAPLLTLDARLSRTHGHRVEVLLLR